MADDTGLANWYSSLAAAIQSVFGPSAVPIQTGPQGDFAYFYQNQNLQFNQWTYDFISPIVGAGDYAGCARLSSSGSFPLGYQQVLNQIAFRLSPADSQALTNAQNSAVQQAGNVVAAWSGAFGPITAADTRTAAAILGYTPQPIDYIVSYQLGSIWSGATPPLTYSQMLKAANLQNLLPHMPSNGGPVVAAVSQYLAAANQALPIMDQISYANWLIHWIKTNLLMQNLMNGSAGMETFDPASGAPSQWVPAYSIGKTTQEIEAQLNDSITITMVVAVTPAGGSQYRVSINGGVPFTTGGPILSASAPADNAASAGAAIAGTSSAPYTLTLTYRGCSLVPVTPRPWLAVAAGANGPPPGWFVPALLAEAYRNYESPNPPSGYVFLSKPSYDLRQFPAGQFNLLGSLILTNYPVVSVDGAMGNSAFSRRLRAALHVEMTGVEMTGGEMTDLQPETPPGGRPQAASRRRPEAAPGGAPLIVPMGSGMKLFGAIPLGPPRRISYSRAAETGLAVPGVPTYQQLAYVLGGTVVSPAAIQTGPASVAAALVNRAGAV